MDKIKIGIPKNIDYSYSYFFKEFFEYLNFEVIVSSNINSLQTINLDDISYLKDKCDYILNIETNKYSKTLNSNLFASKLLNINSCTMYKELKKIGKKFKISRFKIKKSYKRALIKTNKYNKKIDMINKNLIYSVI